MKRILLTAALIGLGGAAMTAQASNVGVSISVGQPGFYGRIDLGNAPAPRLIYDQPVMIERGPPRMAPIYLRVPAGYERDWSRQCYRYAACNQPVYFVRDDWYRTSYVPHYRDHYYGGGWHDGRREAYRDRDRDGIPDRRDPDRGHMRDRDRDGVPDNRDRDHGRGYDNRGRNDRDNRNDRDHRRD